MHFPISVPIRNFRKFRRKIPTSEFPIVSDRKIGFPKEIFPKLIFGTIFGNRKKSKILANVPKSLKKRQKNLSTEKTHEHRSENKMIRKYSNNIIIFNSCNTKKVLKQNNLKKFLSFIDQVYNKTFVSPSVFISTYNTQSIATRLSQTVENKLFYKILISL